NRYFAKEDTQMDNICMKRCSTSLVVREMRIKTTMRFHFTPVRRAAIKTMENSKCWGGCGEIGTLVPCWEYKVVWPLWKRAWRFHKKLKIELPHDPAIPRMGLYPKELKTGDSNQYMYIMFKVVLFIIAKRWKQSKQPLMDKWTNKIWCSHMIVYYSVMKRNKGLIHMTVWRNLENIMLSKRSQS
ncbi:LORF2 protein, partial [Crocuta crocuta]